MINAVRSGAEDEINRSEDAQRGPEVVELERLLHVEQHEGHEDRQRDGLLQDLQLRQRQLGGADAVGRHLQHVFEEGDAPGEDGGEPPRPVVQVLEVGVPGVIGDD